MRIKNKQTIAADEERIRRMVRELPDDKRPRFFREVEKQLKDPDTYATLNFLFIAGLHHFYLGKWVRGFINLGIFLIGMLMLFTSLAGVGLLLLIVITAVELKALFQSQTVVQDYNNGVMERIYREVAAQTEVLPDS
ncbi:TM2 domain-containing protein [Nitrosomonas sp.]|uniref:TM2 domain-containing protein n=1 Tax=Nitrosomonas sp. TaxID=42353 RepID=UPI0025F306D3|nr:TM2 domain-containing protein [Nitrosomonas sp.]